MTQKKITRQDMSAAAEKYKNWGKWGPDDEIGTLNFTSPEDIIAAAQLAKKGQGDLARAQLRPHRPAGREKQISEHGPHQPDPHACCAPAPTPIRACSISAASAPPTTWW